MTLRDKISCKGYVSRRKIGRYIKLQWQFSSIVTSLIVTSYYTYVLIFRLIWMFLWLFGLYCTIASIQSHIIRYYEYGSIDIVKTVDRKLKSNDTLRLHLDEAESDVPFPIIVFCTNSPHSRKKCKYTSCIVIELSYSQLIVYWQINQYFILVKEHYEKREFTKIKKQTKRLC